MITASLISCGGTKNDGPDGEATTDTAEGSGGAESADMSHGVLMSVQYSCAGGSIVEDQFSYYVHEDDGKYYFDAQYYDKNGDHHEENREIPFSDMNALRDIFDKYGYEELVGKRQKPDLGGEEALDAPEYYFAANYADGRSFATDSAGDGAAELLEFFSRLTMN